MTVSAGQSISASDYNTLQSRIAQILGTGAGNEGYGQAVNSSSVVAISDPSIPNGSSVTQDQIQNLLDDFNEVYTHQNGEGIQINSYATGDIIGADVSGSDIVYDANGNVTIQNQDATKGINDFYAEISALETNRFNIAANQQQIDTVLSDTRSRDWNDEIVSEFTVGFTDANNRRYFFNAGGEIRIDAALDLSTSSNLSVQRDSNWKDMLENVGTVKFNHTSTVDTGGAAGTSFPDGVLGNYDLTSNFQTIFRKDANSGDYSNSFWTIEAREDSNNVLRFRIRLIDNGPESDADTGATGSISGGIQEPVEGNITISVSYLKANNAVVVNTPAFNNVNAFDPNTASETFIVTPNNVSPNNNQVVYTNTGVDIQGSEFAVLNGSDTHIRTQWFIQKISDGSTLLLTETGPQTTLNVESKLFDDIRGDNFSYRWQVRYEGQNLGWTPWSDPTTFVTSQYAGFNTLITTNTANFDLEEELRDNWGWDTVQQVQGTMEIASNVFVFSENRDVAAFRIPSLPSGSQISLTNSGRILGKGGNGGFIISPNDTRPGQDGGLAFAVLSPVNVTNFGNISGGGGGGGPAILSDRGETEIFSAGGGAGIGIASGGVAPSGDNGGNSSLSSAGNGGSESGTFTVNPAGSGADGTGGSAAEDPAGTGDTYNASGSANGGDGGGYGQPGQIGTTTLNGVKTPTSINDDVNNPGQPGIAILNESNINWLGGQSNVQGPIVN